MPNRIKELRSQAGLTLEQVAERAGTSLQQIQRLERGGRRLTDDWMRRVAKALGVHPAALLSDSLPDTDRLHKETEHALVLRLWDSMDESEKRWLISLARDKGIQILTDQAKKRSA